MALIDHVIVLDHLQPQVIAGPPSQSYEDVLVQLGVPPEAILALPESHRLQRVGVEGSPKISHSALNFSASGIVTEVAWPCACGAELHVHHDFVLGAWARHVAELEHIDADHVAQHAVVRIDGSWRPDGKPRVECRCGERFESAGWLPADGLQQWERHVRQEPAS